MSFDLMIRNGRIVTTAGTFEGDIGISGGRIMALGRDLGPAAHVIEAAGRVVTPGGVDSHCHIEQLTASGLMNADTFETATSSALMGGTTTVIPFAAQFRDQSLEAVVSDYHECAQRGAFCDYAFHMILTDPRADVLRDELPRLVRTGHTSLKCFLTYDRLRIEDEPFLDVLESARLNGCMVCVHAENHGMITWMSKRLLAEGCVAPRFHVPSHPRLGELEAFERAIAMAMLVGQPIMLFHVSTAEGAGVIHRRQGEGVEVYGETCTQYLTMTAADLDRPGFEGAMWICSPPLREVSDRNALWRALQNGTLSTVSSDHAPYRMDGSGKFAAGPEPDFKRIANGMPGLELRLPVLFDAMVTSGALDLEAFVRLTATEPARIYGLYPRKGTITIGSDADLVVWDADRQVTITHETTHDNAGYSPYVGRTIRGWPQTVVRRGEIVVEDGVMRAAAGSGHFLAREPRTTT